MAPPASGIKKKSEGKKTGFFFTAQSAKTPQCSITVGFCLSPSRLFSRIPTTKSRAGDPRGIPIHHVVYEKTPFFYAKPTGCDPQTRRFFLKR
jgi:hypothetical protein